MRHTVESLHINDRVMLEVCCGNFESALAAVDGGADRIELCSALSVGGLTPSIGDIYRAVALPVKVHVLIRPREGDYCYSSSEVDGMVLDILSCKRAGVDGVVIGALDESGNVDMAACARMVEAAEGVSVTFHRAFDVAADMARALEDLISLGIDTILTSGGMATALEGVDRLRELSDIAVGRISLMPGSGVSHLNAEQIISMVGPSYIHGSCKEIVSSAMSFENPILPNESHMRTSRSSVAALKELLLSMLCPR